MNPTIPPTRPPTADELKSHPVVRQAMEQAWIDSLSNDPIKRHEEGGWICMDTATGQISVESAASGLASAINLNNPPTLPGAVIVGKFHAHPNPNAEGWNTGPSQEDLIIDALHGVPDLIRAEDGVHLSGPESRRGGLAGGPGYPPP